MQIEIFSLCDAATNNSGKISILGAFDTIFAKKTPTTHPQCAVALRIRFEVNEGNDHEVTVSFVNEDGKHVFPPAKGKIKMNFPDNQRSSSTNLVLNFHRLKLEKFGEYAIDLTVDKRNVASLPLYVKQLP